MKIGRRLAIKVLNAAKFVYSFPDAGAPDEFAPLDADMLAGLAGVVRAATAAYDGYDHARALEVTEQFFWTFCDDYLELVKERAYAGDASAVTALRLAIDVLLRLLAPTLAFATEEVWSWTHEGSVHAAPWPSVDELPASERTGLLALAGEALIVLRGAKTEAKVSQRTGVVSATIAAPALLEAALNDLAAVTKIATPTFEAAETVSVRDIVLEDPA